jgi:tetratricopeptide (TPR) repeat protein
MWPYEAVYMRTRPYPCGLAPFFISTAAIAMLQTQVAIAFNGPAMSQTANVTSHVIAAQLATASDFVIESSEKYKKGDLQGAIADLDKAITINPEYAEAYNSRGLTYRALKDYQKAIADYDKAIALSPKLALAYTNRGIIYHVIKEYPKAIADFDKAIEINANHTYAYNSRGSTYAELKEHPKAIADYTKAIEINPDYANAYYNRGNTFAELKDVPKAIMDYRKAADLYRRQNNMAFYQTVLEKLIVLE